MGDSIAYYPNKEYVVFCIFTDLCSIVTFFLLGLLLANGQERIITYLLLCLLGFASNILSILMYRASKLLVCFEPEGLRIMNDRKDPHRFYAWEKLSFGYYCNSFKGHEFLILSSERLSQKQLKYITNKSANTSKVCIDNMVVIPIDRPRDTPQVKEFICKKVQIQA